MTVMTGCSTKSWGLPSFLDLLQLLRTTCESGEQKNINRGNLVGGWATPLKNMKVNWDYYSQYMGK